MPAQPTESKFTDSANSEDTRPIEHDEKRGQENECDGNGQDGRQQKAAHDRQHDCTTNPIPNEAHGLALSVVPRIGEILAENAPRAGPGSTS